MRTLLLVDVDNVPVDTRSYAPAHRLPGEDVAVFVMNLDRAAAMHATGLPERLAAFAQHAAQLPSPPQVEVALGLVAPQSADVLLRRLLTESPTASGQGAFARIVVLTQDTGLRESLGLPLLPWGPYRWRYVANVRSRREFRAPKLMTAPPTPPPRHFTAEVRTAEVASWARGQPIAAPVAPTPKHGPTLAQVAATLVATPHRLSQLGATGSSLGGIERLGVLLRGDHVGLRGCGEGDGVLVDGDGPVPVDVSGVRACSLGPGAVFVDGPSSDGPAHAVVRSRVPPAVLSRLRMAGIPVPIRALAGGAPTLEDGDLLLHLAGGRPVGATVSVYLGHRGPDLFATSVPRGGGAPQAWWLLGPTRQPKAELRVAYAGALQCHPLSLRDIPIVAAQPVAFVHAGAVELVLQAVVPGMVDVPARIPAGGIGEAHAGAQGAALLALYGPVAPSRAVRCVPIQALAHRAGLDFRADLLRLPLVVPEKIDTAVRSSGRAASPSAGERSR